MTVPIDVAALAALVTPALAPLAAGVKRTGWVLGLACGGLFAAVAFLFGPAVGLSGDLLLVVGVPGAVIGGFVVGGLLFRLLR